MSGGNELGGTESAHYDARYHVPRSQVWGGSSGGQSGKTHLHVTEQFDLGRIHRQPSEALCGKRGWYERPPDQWEAADICPRCAEIERRRLTVNAERELEAASPAGETGS